MATKLIFFNIPIESGTIIKPCTLKHFQVTYMLHKAGYWTISCHGFDHAGQMGSCFPRGGISITCARVPTKISEKSSMIFPWLLQTKIQISRQKKIPIFVFAVHVSNCRQTDTDAHSNTDTHMIWSRPTDYSTDFTCDWTDSRSQNYTC